MKACVTGGSGFIGNGLIKALVKHEVNIISVTRKKQVHKGLVEYFHADLSNENGSLENLLDNVSCIFNCAGEINNKKIMHSLHVYGTARLLNEVAKKIKVFKQPIHWVQLSSVGAYGHPSTIASECRVVTEDTPCNPLGEYEVTKTLADELVMQLAATEPLFTYTILRPSNVIGASMPNQSLHALVKMIKKRLFFYIGSRSAVATYIHVGDVVSALMLCGSDLRARGQVFNLSNDCALSEIVSAVAARLKVKPSNLCIPEMPLRILVKLMSWIPGMPLTQERIDALVRHTYYPSNKIKDMLGFVPKRDIPSVITLIFNEKKNAK